MRTYPFLFIGHGLGAITRDFELHIVFKNILTQKERSAVTKEISKAYGKISWIADTVVFHIPGKILQQVKNDPFYKDFPNELERESIFETFEVSKADLDYQMKCFAAYLYDFQTTLLKVHQQFEILLCVRVQGERANLTAWHEWSMQHLDEVFEAAVRIFETAEIKLLRFPKRYGSLNYFQSPACSYCNTLKAVFRNRAGIERVATETGKFIVKQSKKATGFSSNTDNFILSMAMHLTGATLEDMFPDFPEKILEALKKTNLSMPPETRTF